MKYYILNYAKAENEDGKWLKVFLNNGSVVTIVNCYESWQQVGATTEEKSTTVDFAQLFNDWLHGGLPPMKEIINRKIAKIAEEWIKDNLYDVFGDIQHFSERFDLALDKINETHCSLSYINNELYLAMQDKLEEWCTENRFDIKYFDLNDIVI